MKKISIIIMSLLYSIGYTQVSDTLQSNRFSVHAQATIVNQSKAGFKVPYSGTNSLIAAHEAQTSITSTLYLGARLWQGASVYVNPEIAGGSGLSSALGIASATNGETFRVGDPSPKIYLARAFITQKFALSPQTQLLQDDQNQVQELSPTHYFAFTAGKISLADFFDDNKYSHDPRTQFMSWGLMDCGAWDYAANTRGYTPGLVLEYITPKNELRYNLSLLPLAANGNDMNWNISKSNSQTVEFTHRHSLFHKNGAVRLLGFFNNTKMGNYRESIALNPINPDIRATRRYGNSKYGFAVNAEQDFNDFLGGFARLGWNDGKNETWAFTEIDHSISLGISANGKKWNRKGDTAGLAFIASGISAAHADYLKAGGLGFMLGDGNLNYSWEKLTEIYYSAELAKNQMYLTGGYQFILNPGYNADRSGPINVFSIRLHIQL